MRKPVGVIGSGSFGLTISTLLSHNVDVLLYTRRTKTLTDINEHRRYLGFDVSDRITATKDLAVLASSCDLLFPVVPSKSFRSVMKDMSPFLKPHHIIIHATKGLDASKISEEQFYSGNFYRKDIHSMSKVILDETPVLRVGCLSGPNLAREILSGQPAATVIASPFEEVVKKGKEVLSSNVFSVFGSDDMLGAEMAGAVKNIIAIGSGILGGLNMGKNMQSALITRGLREMVQFGEAMGATSTSFFGIAGIGDLIATATSEHSRNFTFGKRLAQGESTNDIIKSSGEVIEGVRTLNIVHHLAKKEKLVLPIVTTLYKAIFEELNIEKGIKILVMHSYGDDVDYLK